MNARPGSNTVTRSLTNPTDFSQCENCGETIVREFVGQPGETHWYHRYLTGRPVRCPK